MTTRPLFSIIVPTFESGPLLRETLNSVLPQECDFEVLIMDGASRDDTPKIARESVENDGRVRLHSEPDGGVYDAMNKGIALACGRYLLFLGAGDTLRPGALQSVALQAPGRDDALLYGDVRQHDGSRYGGRFGRRRLRVQNLPHQAAFYGRDLLRQVGGYDTRFRVYADYDLNLRCWARRDLPKIHLPLLVAHYAKPGLSAQPDARFARYRLRLLRRSLGYDVFLLAWLGGLLPRSLRHALWLPLHHLGLVRHATPAEKSS